MMKLSKTGTKEDLIKWILSNKDAFLAAFSDLLNKASLDQVKVELKYIDNGRKLGSKIKEEVHRPIISQRSIQNKDFPDAIKII